MIMRKTLLIAICAAFVAVAAYAEKRSLNKGWDFVRLTDETGTWQIQNQGSDWHSQFNVEHAGRSGLLAVPSDTLKLEFEKLKTTGWERVTLPHTAFVEDLVIKHPWQGICYYRRELTIDRRDVDKQLWLEFEGAMQLADVWVNGKHLSQHAGGYTPFIVDVTGLLSADRPNEMLVRLDNRNNKLIPPGKPLENLDFCYHSGLYRDVNLIVKPAVHITNPILARKTAGGGIFVTYPYVSADWSLVQVQTEVANRSGRDRHFSLRQTLRRWVPGGKMEKTVARQTCGIDIASGTAQTASQQLRVERPDLWSPEAPNLYVLRTEVLDGSTVVDVEETRIGIRHFEMSREKGLLVNGKPLRLIGTNRHMEYPYVGNALSNNAQYRDMYQIRDNGFNIVRLGHYPQDCSVLDACDELGLLVIEPIPGWQFYNRNPKFSDLTFENVREMIRRDRNHAAVLMWETTLNESWPPTEWKDRAIAVAHAEYPGNQCFTSGDMYGYHGFDVCYNDWNDAEFSRPNNGNKPGFIREYYDYEFGGHYSTSRITRGDGERALVQNLWNLQWSHNRNRTYYPWTMGDAVWSMYDYNRGCCDNICYSGVADVFRLPKFSLSFFRTQQSSGSYTPSGRMPYELFVANYWTATSPDTVKVFGNVDEVELRVNNRVIARQKADSGPNTSYRRRPDTGNCRELDFPPFTFTGVPFEAGCLEAVGYSKGRKVVVRRIQTPGKPAKLSVSYFESGRPASTDDLLIVYVSLQDALGTLCPVNGVSVTLSVEGGTVVGPARYETEAGVASFLVRTSDASVLRLSATSGSMQAVKKVSCVAHK